MFFAITFPIADLRGLHPRKAGRLSRPEWGAHNPKAHFVRGFGAIHSRTKDGSGFVGEHYYADCDRLIRYPSQLFTLPIVTSNRRILAYPIYRRFFFDGILAGRVELGFRLNEATLLDIAERSDPVEFSARQISKAALSQDLNIHLLDDRVLRQSASKSSVALRDGYLLASTATKDLDAYDIQTVGSKYVSVGTPFVFIRASSLTKISIEKNAREIVADSDVRLHLMRSGMPNQDFDTALITSHQALDKETAIERLARLVYTQVRTLGFAHSFYLNQVDSRNIEASNTLAPALTSFIERVRTLTLSLEGASNDQKLTAILSKLDVDAGRLQNELEKRLKNNRAITKLFGFFGYFDKKADKAIEAAASAATKQILKGGL